MRRSLQLALAALLCAFAAAPASAGPADPEPRFELSGDFRLRFEADWDSRRQDGTPRADRSRLRARARVGLAWRLADRLSFAARLRSGSDASHQSPHVTLLDFDGNDTGDAHFNLDRWALAVRGERLWGWAGRDRFPFWKQNEMLWDDDATLAGVAGGWSGEIGGGGRLSAIVALLSPPVGMRRFSGRLTGGQLVYERDRHRRGLTLAAALYALDAEPADPDATLLANGNGLRDYSILALAGRTRARAAGRPLVLGLDYMHNFESYGRDDAYGFANRDETDGLVLSLVSGSAAAPGDWLVGWWYAEIGALAVNGSYAQDDWVRWGSAGQTEGSDLRGHELRIARGLAGGANLMARLFVVESLTGPQDGKRLRLDYNLRF